MTTPLKLLTAVLLFPFLTSSKEKNEVDIWYPQEVGIVQTCNGLDVEILIEISTESKKKIKVHSFSLDNSDFLIFDNGIAFSHTDTKFLSKSSPLNLKIKYNIQPSDKPAAFSFKTNLDKYSSNHIKLNYGEYSITTSDIEAGKEQIINVSESCQDSIKVIFPFGGTISSATLYSDSTQTKKESKLISYAYGEDGNSINFSQADIGRYYVEFISCHWGGEFWLTIK